jgi:hypothetical protein
MFHHLFNRQEYRAKDKSLYFLSEDLLLKAFKRRTFSIRKKKQSLISWFLSVTGKA